MRLAPDGRVVRWGELTACVGLPSIGEAMAASHLTAGWLVRILPNYETPTRPLHVVFAAGRPSTKTLSAFVDHVVAADGLHARR